jgi:hypothetical protein
MTANAGRRGAEMSATTMPPSSRSSDTAHEEIDQVVERSTDVGRKFDQQQDREDVTKEDGLEKENASNEMTPDGPESILPTTHSTGLVDQTAYLGWRYVCRDNRSLTKVLCGSRFRFFNAALGPTQSQLRTSSSHRHYSAHSSSTSLIRSTRL